MLLVGKVCLTHKIYDRLEIFEMKKITLCALVIATVVFLQGCGSLRVNLSSSDKADSALPVISTFQCRSCSPYPKITAIDGKVLDGILSANVDPGKHEVLYVCDQNPSQQLTINAEPGTSYVLKIKQNLDTTVSKSTNFIGNQGYLERNAAGQLIQRYEPVYAESNRVRTIDKGCSAEVVVCNGYPYKDALYDQLLCFNEPLGTFKGLVNDNLKKLF